MISNTQFEYYLMQNILYNITRNNNNSNNSI